MSAEQRRAFLTAEWRYLVMLNYDVDPAVLHALVPRHKLVPRLAIALTARLAYNEPYRAVRMRSVAPATVVEDPGRISYEWKSGARWQHVSALTTGGAALPLPGAEAAFITEHYWGYTRQRDGGTVEYEVQHPRWRLWAASEPSLDADVPRLYGSSFARALASPPVSACIADWSEVTVYRPRLLAP